MLCHNQAFLLSSKVDMFKSHGTRLRARVTLEEERAAREAAEGAAERVRAELDGLRAAQARPRAALLSAVIVGLRVVRWRGWCALQSAMCKAPPSP